MNTADQPIETPDALQGLGLSQEQLAMLQEYFQLRQYLAQRQRLQFAWVLFGVVGIVVGPWLLQQAIGTEMFIPAFLVITLKWMPALLVVIAAIPLVFLKFTVMRLNKGLEAMNLSDRVLNHIHSLANSVVLWTWTGRRLPSH